MNRLAEILSINTLQGDSDIPVLLAPMAGITDWAYRTPAEAQGCDAATTEMISAQGYIYAKRSLSNYQRLIARAPYEKPLSVQLFGHEPVYMGEAAHLLSNLQRYSCIDINMGCPARKVTSGGSGSALMRNEVLAGQVIASVVKGSLLPVSVKMRLGWDQDHINAVNLAKIAESEGAAFITVHGRTTAQQYSGHANWAAIAEVKQSVKIPVIANGDIADGASAVEALKTTKADGLAIGRASLGNPWVFRAVHSTIRGEVYTPPTGSERLKEAEKHARLLRAWLPEHRALLEMRKFYAWYIKGMRGAAECRTRINQASDFDEIQTVLSELQESNLEG